LVTKKGVEAVMDIKKIAPWNWFKKEEEGSGAVVPVKRSEKQSIHREDSASHPMIQLQQDMDRLLERAVRGFGLSPLSNEWLTPLSAPGLLRPQLDIAATDKEYSITVEVPGVSEKDVRIEIANDTMTITGEKRQEKEEKEKNVSIFCARLGFYESINSKRLRHLSAGA
jgi:HSP20 family protein